MKLDVTCFRYLTKEDFRVLEAIEQGMRNHELVPIDLITSLAKLRHGGIHRFLSNVLRYKLVAHANLEYNGYRLSYLGFDILALHVLMMRGVISSVGPQIGVGKESDIFEAQDDNGNDIVLKIHRLGRTSFRSVRKNRDYMAGRSKASWLYMSKLAAIKEFSFMKALYAHGFPTPVPIDQNRHVVAMNRIKGFPLAQIKSGRMEGADAVFRTCLDILYRLAEHGLVHCDFNEFNIMVDEEAHVTLIDFPQMVAVSHHNANELFQRDINGLVKFFAMKMHYIPPDEAIKSLSDIVRSESNIESELKTMPSLNEAEDNELQEYLISRIDEAGKSDHEIEDDGSDEESEEADGVDCDDEGHTTEKLTEAGDRETMDEDVKEDVDDASSSHIQTLAPSLQDNVIDRARR